MNSEFGDFQTPPGLARQVCQFLARRNIRPASIVEPTCGIGHFLFAALEQFPDARTVGVEINPAYVEKLKRSCPASRIKPKIHCESFFECDWALLLRRLPEPILVIGNPPWVTNAQLGGLGSANLPGKSNFQELDGLAALTGKSNFDISEWMLIKLLELLKGRQATLAMLCKTAVARKALAHAWKTGISIANAEIRQIDAKAHFGAAVDACLLVCSLGVAAIHDCDVFSSLDARHPQRTIGFRDGKILADVGAYERWKHLAAAGSTLVWRSGIKHDCSKVMEFRKERTGYRNGLGELIDLEDTFLFPMLKSSELAKSSMPSRWMLVTQTAVGEDTAAIRSMAPKTWEYLESHAATLDRRASKIYRMRPRFSIFGVGGYSFAPWKVAISGFYKKLEFVVVGSSGGKPIVLDDTAYFLACADQNEARRLAALLNSDVAREFFSAFIFWDAKRPITVEVLRKLDLALLAAS